MHDQAHAFAIIAREYCDWAEGVPASRDEDVAEALSLLLNLYLAALRLPEGEGSDEEIPSNSQEEWMRIYRRFASLPIELYYEVFDPLESPPKVPGGATLGDDLADIHRDLQRGLILYERGEVSAATWEWSFHFRAHWGYHLTGAVRALHAWWAANYFKAFGATDKA